MPLFRSSPFEELVAQATNEQHVTEDWSTIMDICDKTVNYEDGQKFCLQAIVKRLYHKVPRVVMQALVLLDACVQNCGKKFHLEVSSRYFVTEIQKLLPKLQVSAAEKLKQLLRRWAENVFKNDPELGLIPSLYYKLKSEGVEFPPEEEEKPAAAPVSTDPNVVSSQQEEEDIIKAIALSLNGTQSSPVKEDTTDSSSASSVVTNEPIKVRALYDFEAVEENELTIMAGEIVLILDRSNNSWWKGSNHRGEGYLPANFVTENLDETPEISNSVVDVEETLPKQVDDIDPVDEVTVIDEDKIQQALDWLNDIDPTSQTEDPEELLILERQSYAMAPLIDEKLQRIDKKCTILNSLNEELMDAVQMFYSLNPLGSMPPSSDHFHMQDVRPNSVGGQCGYVVPQQYVAKSSEKSPAPGTCFVPVEASQAIPGIHYPNMSQPSFPSYCYQPVYAVLPPKTDPGHQMVVAGLPPSGGLPQQMPNSTASSSVESNPVTNGISSDTYTSALPRPASVSFVYQPFMLQQQQLSPANTLAYATYPRNVQHETVMHPEAMNSYMPHYVAQVVVPSSASAQPATHQTSAELPPDVESIQPTAASSTTNEAASAVTVNTTAALSNPECDVKSMQ